MDPIQCRLLLSKHPVDRKVDLSEASECCHCRVSSSWPHSSFEN